MVTEKFLRHIFRPVGQQRNAEEIFLFGELDGVLDFFHRHAPRAVLRVTDPDGRTRDVVVEASGLTIGRATDNDLVAIDGRVSRHHGRIVGRRGTLVYSDLGSTNGSRVNGVPVAEVVLGVGDRLEVGDTSLVVEVAGAPD